MPVTVVVNGDTLFELNESFSLVLSSGATPVVSGTGTITNDDAQPALSIADVSQSEGNVAGTMVFTVTLSGSTSLPVSVQYATANGTATAGSDYTATSGTLTFAPGVTVQTISVPVTGDITFEPDETFTVTLSNPTNAVLTRAAATGTLVNDDSGSDLRITKTAGSAIVLAGSNVTYQIVVTNLGPLAATGVIVDDVLPAGTTFVSATPTQGTCTGTSNVQCALGSIASGGSATVALTLRTPSVPGTITNTASETSVQGDPNPANNAASAGVNVQLPAVPTLSSWMLILMAAVLAAVALKVVKS
jgi:uncharacterized repeat protein (TIGR01451 family)